MARAAILGATGPTGMMPVSYDAGRLTDLMGPQPMTSYESGIEATLDWIAAQPPAREAD